MVRRRSNANIVLAMKTIGFSLFFARASPAVIGCPEFQDAEDDEVADEAGKTYHNLLSQ